MSEIKAQLYAGNPLSITDDELLRLIHQPQFGFYAERRPTRKAVIRKIGGISPLYTVFVPPRRVGDEQVLATNATHAASQLIIDGAKYLHLLPAAIMELREPHDKLAANIVEHINGLLSGALNDDEKAEMVTMVLSLLDAEQLRWCA